MIRTIRLLQFLCSAVVILALASPAFAVTPRDHEDGFFLRLSVGGGPADTDIDHPDLNAEFSGSGVDLNIAIGGMVAPNLALHGTVFGWLVSEPDATIQDVSGTLMADISMTAVGGGLTYYFMPTNLYISGSVGAATLTLESFGVELESDTGLAVDMTLGKEWWVSDRWGLGVAGGVGFHSIPIPDVDDNWTGTNIAVRFTATLN